MTYRPEPRVLELGPGFFDEVHAARFPEHRLRFRNDRWASRVGLDGLSRDAWEGHFARFEPLPGNLAVPLALRYHGHQFGVYNPDLGDGRGFLFAQLREDGAPEGRLLDLGTKGSGTTPWSRGADGRLTLQGAVREVLAAEMLEALGVPTSKAFSLFETGERLMRSDEPSPTRSGVLTRLSHGHIRFGTFQRLARLRDERAMQALVEHTIEVHFPWLAGAHDPPLVLLREVVKRTARLAATWRVAGFVHGVLNTDNMNITGESFDYGPWRFLVEWDDDFVAAYFDRTGMYAFGQQATVLRWNLGRLAEALRTAAPSSPLAGALDDFGPALEREVGLATVRRLGLASSGAALDGALATAVEGALRATRVPIVQLYADWFGGADAERRALAGPARQAWESAPASVFRHVLEAFAPACPAAPTVGRDPVDLHLDTVRAIWDAIARGDDWSPFEASIARMHALGAQCAGAGV